MFQIVVFGILVAAIGGYIANIVKLIGLIGHDFGLLAVLRIVGVLTGPFGSIMGFIPN
jgi:hypothetical protein